MVTIISQSPRVTLVTLLGLALLVLLVAGPSSAHPAHHKGKSTTSGRKVSTGGKSKHTTLHASTIPVTGTSLASTPVGAPVGASENPAVTGEITSAVQMTADATNTSIPVETATVDGGPPSSVAAGMNSGDSTSADGASAAPPDMSAASPAA